MVREYIAAVRPPSDCDCEKTDRKCGADADDGTSEIPVVLNQTNESESSTQAYERPDNKNNLA